MARSKGGRAGSVTPPPTVPDGRPGRRPTAADVAQRAGLSRATVSYVLNDTPHQVIPEHTRRRVHDAAAELGYVPSAAARALSSGRSDVVLLLLPDWPIGPSVGALLEHLSTALAAHGYTFVAHPQSARRPVSEVWKALTPAAVVTFEELDDGEAAVVMDIDRSIFGRDPLRFMDFEYGVEERESTVPTLAFRRGRGRFLAGLLESPIYRTSSFRDRFEAAARANIGALLESRRYAAYRWLRWLPEKRLAVGRSAP